MSVAALLALLVIAMLLLSGLRLELQYRRGLKVGAGAAAGGSERLTVARPALRRVPDPYSD
jgi:hypothetical protein